MVDDAVRLLWLTHNATPSIETVYVNAVTRIITISTVTEVYVYISNTQYYIHVRDDRTGPNETRAFLKRIIKWYYSRTYDDSVETDNEWDARKCYRKSKPPEHCNIWIISPLKSRHSRQCCRQTNSWCLSIILYVTIRFDELFSDILCWFVRGFIMNERLRLGVLTRVAQSRRYSTTIKTKNSKLSLFSTPEMLFLNL